MDNIEDTVNELANSEFVIIPEEFCDNWPVLLQDGIQILLTIIQSFKQKLQLHSVTNPQCISKEVKVELKSTQETLNGTKAEVSVLSGEHFQCPFGICPEDIKDSLVYFTIVFKGKDVGSAIMLNEKLNTIMLPAIMNNNHFKQYEETKKKLTVRRIEDKVYAVLAKEMPDNLKELSQLASEIFVSNGTFSLNNTLKAETAFKLNDLNHLNLNDIIRRLTTLNINLNLNIANIDFILETIIEKWADFVQEVLYGDEEFLNVLRIIKMIKTVSMDVNFLPLEKIIMSKLTGHKSKGDVEQDFEVEKAEIVKDVKEIKDFLGSLGLKEYIDLIDLDVFEIHIVKPTIKFGINIKIAIPGLTQIVS